jgi:hypothetical protein
MSVDRIAQKIVSLDSRPLIIHEWTNSAADAQNNNPIPEARWSVNFFHQKLITIIRTNPIVEIRSNPFDAFPSNTKKIVIAPTKDARLAQAILDFDIMYSLCQFFMQANR